MSAQDHKVTIGLCMIAKNEAHVIEKCLESVSRLTDYVLIEDTGSTDGTQRVIKDWLKRKNMPGDVIEEPWRDFAYNRSHALAKLREVEDIDYALIIDADDVLDIDPELGVDDLKQSLTKGSYSIEIRHGPIVHRRPHLCSNHEPFIFRGAIHEFLDLPPGAKTAGHGYLAGISIRIVGGGSRSSDTEKFQRDAELIEDVLATEDDSFLRSRYIFYLAQSYRDSGQSEKALHCYMQRADLGNWMEEIYQALLQGARIKEQLNYPAEDILATYRRAIDAVPSRAEAFHGASRYCRLIGRNRDGYEFARPASDLRKPDGLFIESWIYEYGLLDEFSINAYWAGDYKACLSACMRLLESPTFPPDQRPRAIANAQFAVNQLQGTPKLGSAGALSYVDQYPVQPARDLYSRAAPMPRVLLAILAKQKEAELPLYLKCIDSLHYPKSQIILYIRTNNNTDRTAEILRDWVRSHGHLYAKVEVDFSDVPEPVQSFQPHEWNAMRFRVLGEIRTVSMKRTLFHGCEFYFVCDVDNFLHPCTLRELVSLGLPICAPFLRAQNAPSLYSNYHAEVDRNGYYADTDQYGWIANRHVRGLIEVPVVHCTYLVRADVIDCLAYVDGSDRYEYVVFSHSARSAGIPQYLDNRQVYGYMVFKPEDLALVNELMRHVLPLESEDSCHISLGGALPGRNPPVESRSASRLGEALLELARWRDLGANQPDEDATRFFDFCLKHLARTKSQNFQELFALYVLRDISWGFFVEFGAGDGVYLSNTHMLEFERGWRGILAEPAKKHHLALRSARKCAIDDRCIWIEDNGTVAFVEAPEAELSTMADFVNADRHGAHRVSGARYDVPTVSLATLLDEHSAPRRIDYLSLDTEGSELAILQCFDFDKYDVRVITVEHNYTKNRELIYELLTSKGFVRRFEAFSKWDDWYVRREASSS